MNNLKILSRLYKSYTRKYLKNILISVFFTLLLAGSTSAVAYLLDPAIKQLFIEQIPLESFNQLPASSLVMLGVR